MHALESQVQQLMIERDSYKQMQFVPPGHFYSAIPNLEEVRQREKRLFQSPEQTLPAININDEKQCAYLEEFADYYQEQSFPVKKKNTFRFFFENPAFAYADGLILYSMIRSIKPKRIIEVGSGYSSCMTLDTNERYFNNDIKCTFMEPYPDLLLNLINPEDLTRIELLILNLQDVELERFRQLEAGDILFIDSTHVGKIGSDVNDLFFRILPSLQKGVIIHFHDIFYPFEYPKEWIFEGRAWNENYYLRAFLEYNESFEILYFNDYMRQFHKALMLQKMPLCLQNTGGSIWLKKVK